MMKALLSFFVLIPFFLNAQFDPKKINSKLESVYVGTIQLNDGSELSCNFSYNSVVAEGILLIKTDSSSQVYLTNQVKSFHFYDQDLAAQRNFYSLPMPGNEGATKKYFFEVIHSSNQISIMGRNTYRVTKTHYKLFTVGRVPVSVPDQWVLKNYTKYLFDHREKSIHSFSKKAVLSLMADRKEEVRKFLESKRFKLRSQNVDQFIALIDFYCSL